jgi:hypothetical protein
VARSAIRARCSSSAGPKLQQLLNDVYPVGVIGIDAGTRQHIIDADNHGGGLFARIGMGELMFALPEYEVYVRAKLGDVL